MCSNPVSLAQTVKTKHDWWTNLEGCNQCYCISSYRGCFKFPIAVIHQFDGSQHTGSWILTSVTSRIRPLMIILILITVNIPTTINLQLRNRNILIRPSSTGCCELAKGLGSRFTSVHEKILDLPLTLCFFSFTAQHGHRRPQNSRG